MIRRGRLVVSGDTRDHYDRLAGRYDGNWVHSPAFIAWMTGRIVDRLDPQPGERVADIGCGTGLFASGLAERAGRVWCVDPSPGMLAQLPADERLVPVNASAEDVAAGRVRLPADALDVVLVKEAIHHVADPAGVLAGLLAPGGGCGVLMLTRPARSALRSIRKRIAA